MAHHSSHCVQGNDVTVQGVMDSVPASRNYQGGFATKLMLKDLGLAEAAAQHCSASVPMSAQAAKLYQQVLHPAAMLQVAPCYA